MASDITDDFIQSSRLLRRRCVQIPKEQKELLEQDAWFDTLNSGKHPMLNVPPDVLQNLKDLHMNKNGKPSQPSPSVSRPSTAISAKRPPKSIRQKKSSALLANADAEDSDDQPLCSSWEPTQDPDGIRRVAESEEPVEVEVEVPNSSPVQPLRSSPPSNQFKRKLTPSFVNNGPSSSGAASENLDIEPLGFVSHELEPPVNRTASRLVATGAHRLGATPPSAQMPVAIVQRIAKPSPSKKRRIGEIIRSDGERELSQPVPASQRSSSGKFVDSNQNSLSTSATTSSLSAQHVRHGRNQSSEQRSMSDPALYQQNSSLPPTYEGRQRAVAAENLVFKGTSLPGPSHAPPPAQKNAPSKGSSNPTIPQMSSREPLVQSQSASPAPATFETFRAVYPDYTGSRRHFVTALIVVEQLKRRREAHSSLYDDFIRAYTSEYFVYISECGRKGSRKILPGIEWYNEYVSDILYTKGVVRKDNLDDFLAACSDEVQSVKQLTGDLPSDTGESDEDMSDAMDEDNETKQDEADEVEHEEQVPEIIDLDADDTEYQIQSPTMLMEAGRQISLEEEIKSPSPVDKPAQSFRSQNSATFLTPPKKSIPFTGDTINGHVNDAEAENVQDTEAPLGEENGSRSSPEFHIESPSDAIHAVVLNDWNAAATPGQDGLPRARKSPTSAKSFASQETSHELLQPIVSSSPEASTLPDGQQATRGHSISPPQRPARPSLLNVPPKATVEGKKDDEDGNFPPLQRISPGRSAQPLSSNVPRKAIVEHEENDEDNSFQPPPMPMPPSRWSARPSPNKQPVTPHKQPASVSSDDDDDDDDDDDEGPQLPMPPLREPPRRRSSARQPSSILRNKKAVDHYDLIGSSPPQAVAPSPRPVTERLSTGFTDGGIEFATQVSMTATQEISVRKAKPPIFEAHPAEPATKELSTDGTDGGNAFATQVSTATTQEGPVRKAKPSLFDTDPPKEMARISLPTAKSAASTSAQAEAARPTLTSTLPAVIPSGSEWPRSMARTSPAVAMSAASPPTITESARPTFTSTMPAVVQSGPEGPMARASSIATKPDTSPSTTTEAARPAFSSTMPAVNPAGLEPGTMAQPKQPTALVSKAAAPSLGTGTGSSRASSTAPAKRPRMTRAEREKFLQDMARKRKTAVGSDTPSATPASKQ